ILGRPLLRRQSQGRRRIQGVRASHARRHRRGRSVCCWTARKRRVGRFFDLSKSS
ncbi:hypothetical protein LTR40_011344, partial [Exophiala xenobiotica]